MFLLALLKRILSTIKIDRYRASSTPAYILATKTFQGNQPLTDDGAWCQ